MGVGCEINLIDAEPTEEQIALFAVMIRAMRDIPTEHVIFDFMNANYGPGMQQGLVFYQVCRAGKKIHAEIRIDRAEGRFMYSTTMEDDEATELLRQLIRTRMPPDLAGWKDITEKVFSDNSEIE